VDLRAASPRLSRLPFLLSTEFALEKGSERGRHVLVITVAETKPFFFLVDGRATRKPDSQNAVDIDFDPAAGSNDGAFGFRSFVGDRGMLHFGMTVRRSRQAFSRNYSAWEAGYTRYELFGSRAFATLNVHVPVDSVTEGFLTPQLVVGVPLTARQTLTFDFEDTKFASETLHIAGNKFHRDDAERRVSLAWTYNTTNDPFLPTQGTFLSIAPIRVMHDRASVTFIPAGPQLTFVPYSNHTNADGIDVDAVHYWEVSEVHSFSAGVLAGWASVDDRKNPKVTPDVTWQPAYQILQGGYARRVHFHESSNSQSHIEFDGRYVLKQSNFSDAQTPGPDADRSVELSIAFARRSAWGSIRLGVGYAWAY
jgi:hypothetical protein